LGSCPPKQSVYTRLGRRLSLDCPTRRCVESSRRCRQGPGAARGTLLRRDARAEAEPSGLDGRRAAARCQRERASPTPTQGQAASMPWNNLAKFGFTTRKIPRQSLVVPWDLAIADEDRHRCQARQDDIPALALLCAAVIRRGGHRVCTRDHVALTGKRDFLLIQGRSPLQAQPPGGALRIILLAHSEILDLEGDRHWKKPSTNLTLGAAAPCKCAGFWPCKRPGFSSGRSRSRRSFRGKADPGAELLAN